MEERGKRKGKIDEVVKMMILVMEKVLMVKLKRLKRMLIVVEVEKIGLIGVVEELMKRGKKIGLVEIIGVMEMIGIIIRK